MKQAEFDHHSLHYQIGAQGVVAAVFVVEEMVAAAAVVVVFVNRC